MMEAGNGPHDCSSEKCDIKGLCKVCWKNLGEAPSLRRAVRDHTAAFAMRKLALLKLFELCGTLTRIVNTPVADSALEEINERLDWLRDHLSQDQELVDSAKVAAQAFVERERWKEVAMGALLRSCIGCNGGLLLYEREGSVMHMSEDTAVPCTADPMLRDACEKLLAGGA